MSDQEQADRKNLVLRIRMTMVDTMKLRHHLDQYAEGKPINVAGLQALALGIIAGLADIAGELS